MNLLPAFLKPIDKNYVNSKDLGKEFGKDHEEVISNICKMLLCSVGVSKDDASALVDANLGSVGVSKDDASAIVDRVVEIAEGFGDEVAMHVDRGGFIEGVDLSNIMVLLLRNSVRTGAFDQSVALSLKATIDYQETILHQQSAQLTRIEEEQASPTRWLKRLFRKYDTKETSLTRLSDLVAGLQKEYGFVNGEVLYKVIRDNCETYGRRPIHVERKKAVKLVKKIYEESDEVGLDLFSHPLIPGNFKLCKCGENSPAL